MPAISFLILFATLLAGCRNQPDESIQPPTPSDMEQIDILALGDSYTKGESVPAAQNFPSQFADSLRLEGHVVTGLRIIAQTGWRTDQLKNAVAQASEIKDSVFSLVTLAIGVNNLYQNGSIDTYEKEFEELLQIALTRAGGRRERVFVLSIPDYAYTPYGQGNPAISQKTDQFNAVNKTITGQYGVAYIDVTPISRRGLEEPALVAQDGLHPSALQYAAWVKLLLPVVRGSLQ